MQTGTLDLPAVLNAREVARLLAQDAPLRIIDVRTPAEFESVHIPGSYNVPLDLLGEHREELHRALSEPVLLVCRSGGRASQAAGILQAAGLPHVHVLEAGIDGWLAAGQRVRRGQQRWSLERQVRGVAGSLVVAGTLGGLLVHPLVGLLALGVGAGLTFSAITDSCGMAMLLAKLPYNRGATCDIREIVARLEAGEPA